MGRKGARGKVPAWLVVVAFTQLALTLWFVRSIGAGPSAKQEEARPREVVEVVETTPAVTVAKETLGWEPKVSLDEGLVPTIEYFDKLLSEQSG